MSLAMSTESVTPESNVTVQPPVTPTRNAPLSNAERQRLYRQRQRQREKRQAIAQDEPAAASGRANVALPAEIMSENDSSPSNVIRITPRTDDRSTRKASKARNGDGPKPPPTPVLTAPPRTPKGREPKYCEEIMDEVLRRISHGETLKRVCASNPDFPSPATVIEWVHQNRCGLADRYARARDRQLEAWAEEVLDKADAASTDNGAVNRDRLAVDARKWLLSKLKPERYGDKLDVTSAGKPLASASDLDIAKALAHALAPALPAPEPIDVESVPVEPEGEP
jgi:hypothetical protein